MDDNCYWGDCQWIKKGLFEHVTVGCWPNMFNYDSAGPVLMKYFHYYFQN